VVLDAFSRRAVGWALARNLQTPLPLAALESAIHSRQPKPGLVHHSDRGSQHASNDYVKLDGRARRLWTCTGPEDRGRLIMTSERRGIAASRAFPRTRAVVPVFAVSLSEKTNRLSLYKRTFVVRNAIGMGSLRLPGTQAGGWPRRSTSAMMS
jgi:hypothetical protein